MQLEYYARTETGHVRPTNQDYVGCFPELGLFAVADGMGGHEAGEVASRLAVENLHRCFQETPNHRPAERLATAVAVSNEAIFDAGRMGGRVSTRPMGTTVVSLWISAEPNRAHWAHVGDSRLYLQRQDELRLLTSDHTRYGGKFAGKDQVPLDLPHTNELLAALGIDEDVVPGTGHVTWRDGDVYLLCSDGISGLLSPGQLQAILASGGPVDEMGTRLVDEALAAGGTDNASVVLVRASR